MPRKEIIGDWVFGWPDRKRHLMSSGKDAEDRVIHSRTPFLELEGLITPTDASYIVTQLAMPEPVHPDDYKFEVTGEVENPGTYSIEELRRLPGHTVRAVAECAGNDTAFWDYLKSRDEGGNVPKPSFLIDDELAMTWQGKANEADFKMDEIAGVNPTTCFLSGGEWTGVALREVLNAASLKDTAVAIRIEGFDEGRPDPTYQYLSVGNADFEVFDPGVINYDKGLPINKAMDPDTVLAWAHNGEWLTHVHGAPVRLIVPGWAGNWWVKWINKIEVMDHMPDCYHQTHYFVSGKSPDDPDKKAMTALGVKTVITEPQDQESPLGCGSHGIRGLAWSGEGAMVRVEVSTDSGEIWHDAHVEEHGDRYLWRRFSYVWNVDEPGNYTLMSRGTDEKGRRQPVTEWNFQRKHFDGIIPVEIVIE